MVNPFRSLLIFVLVMSLCCLHTLPSWAQPEPLAIESAQVYNIEPGFQSLLTPPQPQGPLISLGTQSNDLPYFGTYLLWTLMGYAINTVVIFAAVSPLLIKGQTGRAVSALSIGYGIHLTITLFELISGFSAGTFKFATASHFIMPIIAGVINTLFFLIVFFHGLIFVW